MIVVIPARGGSKGLPGKNIIDFCGVPLIAHAINAARQASEVSRIIVTTDCEDIAAVAREYGAEVPFMRPAGLASDTAVAIDVYLHVFDWLQETEHSSASELCVLLPTCPLRNSDDIDSAIKLFREQEAESVVSYTQESHPVSWHKYINEDGSFEGIFPGTLRNRQEERTSYYPNGAIFIFSKSLLESGKYYSDKSYAYLMPRNRSVDIDTLDDLKYAEFLVSNYQ